MKRLFTTVLAVASLATFGACKNGSNNARDTTGMTNSSAAGSLGDTVGGATGAPAAGAAGAGAAVTPLPPVDTAIRDTSKKKDSAYRKP